MNAMRWVGWIFWGVVLALVAALLHYNLPRREIVRITGVEIKLERIDPNSVFWAASENAATATGLVERDVRFIDTVRADGGVMVFRNEDTGGGWPPYFKFDSANLQAEARNLVSTASDPQWVAVRYYGWRLPLLSVYPNALSVRPVEGPDTRLIPWFNIVFLTVLLAVVWAVGVRLRRWSRRHVSPWLDRGDRRVAIWTDAIRRRRDARAGRRDDS
ncbi:MAG: DUF1523 family protein [Limimaricola soesokkakensis]|uniref:Uncharacterized protein DUF1523 n=1 Tax=Limimaricola soesokkakensis TaxID=1343159 RepID=A0A1X6ZJC4_9RHOB|nr:DUF1523 family protein [Limimaricola soesokkakensis]PSK84900.1 uncharacterized protein DUF1523 [Limimaricola soesokkakensis]SLN52818.1 hypothetical protein LOS8367_02448 [Limimaricola soesokkakensis]